MTPRQQTIDPLDFPCPTCGAPPGLACMFRGLFDRRTPAQYAATVTARMHRARVKRAEKQPPPR